MVGGTTPCSSAMAQAMTSMAPVAPIMWPVIDLVDRDVCGACRVLAERTLYARRLGRIVELGRGAVSVDVKALGRLNVALDHRQRYRTGNAGSLGIGARDVIGIIGVAVAHDLGINVRTARLRMLHALENQHAGALAHHKAVAVCIERAASRQRVRISGESTAGCKARNGIGDDCGLGAAGQDCIGHSRA